MARTAAGRRASGHLRRGVEHPARIVHQGVADQARDAQVLAVGRVGHGRVDGDLPDLIEEQQGQLHAADTVGEAVVELHDDCRPAVGQPFHDGGLPQRVRRVERRHGIPPCELHDLLPGRKGFPPEVPRQVEVRVEGPAGRGQPQRRLHHPLPEHGQLPGEAGGTCGQAGGIRRAVESEDRDDRRAQGGVPLHVPGERVAVAHVDLGVGHGGLLRRATSVATSSVYGSRGQRQGRWSRVRGPIRHHVDVPGPRHVWSQPPRDDRRALPSERCPSGSTSSTRRGTTSGRR